MCWWSDPCVMLVYTTQQNGKYKRIWREFSLPLSIHKVENWCHLNNILFYEVPTFNNLSKETSEGGNFFSYRHHIVNDDVNISVSELKNGHCYMVCGYSSIAASPESDRIPASSANNTITNNNLDTINQNNSHEQKIDATSDWVTSSTDPSYFFENVDDVSNRMQMDDQSSFVTNMFSEPNLGNQSIMAKPEDIQNFMIIAGIDYEFAAHYLDINLGNITNALTNYFECKYALDYDVMNNDQLEMEKNRLQSMLLQFAADGDVEKFNILMSLPQDIIDPAYTDDEGVTALMKAAMHGHDLIIEKLLNNNISLITINFQDQVQGFTALHYAAGNNHVSSFRLLYLHGADIRILDKDHYSVLHLALVKNALQIVDLCIELVDNNVDMQAINDQTADSGTTPLMYAIHFKYYNTALSMLNHIDVLDLMLMDEEGYTALIHAVIENHLDLVKAILRYPSGVESINLQSNTGKTALMFAAINNNIQIMEELITHGAAIDTQDNEMDYSAAMFALAFDNYEAAKLLIRNGCDVVSKYGDLSITEFCTLNNLSELLDEITQRNRKMKQVNLLQVFDAIEHNDYDSVQRYIQEDITCLKKQHPITGETVLHKAVSMGFIFIVIELLKYDIDVNVQDIFGRTALHIANYYKHYEIAQELLKKNACLSIQDLIGVYAGAINENTKSLLIDRSEVQNLEFERNTSPAVPQGEVFRGLFRGKTVEVIEYPLKSRQEALNTYIVLVQLVHKLPKIYNKVLPSTEKIRNPNSALYSLYPNIFAIYFNNNKVGIVQDIPRVESLPFDIHHSEAKSVLLKMDLCIQLLNNLAILHCLGITHGNIRKDNVLRTSDGSIILRNFALPCIVDNFGSYNTIAPEVLVGGFQALSAKADAYSAAVIMFELFVQQKYDPNKSKYDIDPTTNIVPDKLWKLFSNCTRPDVEIRVGDCKFAVEWLLKYREELIATPLLNQVDDTIREIQMINMYNNLRFSKFMKMKYDAYSFRDFNVPNICFATNNLVSKCISKIKDSLEGVNLSSEEITSLAQLDEFLSSSYDPAKNKLINDTTFTLIHKLLTRMKEQLMILDLLRLLVLYDFVLYQLLTDPHVYVLDATIELAKTKYHSISNNAKMMLNRLFCNLAMNINGRNYLTSPKKISTVISVISDSLTLQGDEKSLNLVRATASALVMNLRYDIHRPTLDLEMPSVPTLDPESKSLTLAIINCLISSHSDFADDILCRLSVTLYSLMKQDDMIISLVSESDKQLEKNIKRLMDIKYDDLYVAFDALLNLKAAEYIE
jgi:ankyrin repeat protein/serine/threonine protein kinase